MNKVLIISYYWPPAGGPGVQRVLKFVKYLPEFGWQPFVLTVADGDYPAWDPSLTVDIQPDLPVYKTRALEPFRFYRKVAGLKINEEIPTFVLNPHYQEKTSNRITRWIRANFFIPDARLGWIPPARRLGMKLVHQHKIDLIWASSPPHSVQLIARYLAQRTGLKWIADLRDPWTEAFWQRELPATYPARKLNAYLERKVLNSAAAITTVSEGLRQIFQRKSHRLCRVITNGYDTADYASLPPRVTNPRFTIVYAGNLGKDQSLQPLVKAIRDIPSHFYPKLALHIFGNLHQQIQSEIKAFPPEIDLRIEPYQMHAQIIKSMYQADLLLLVIPNTPDNQGIVTGKLFEYLATGNYILGIGPTDGDAAVILHNTAAGEVFDYEADLRPALLQEFEKWEQGISDRRISPGVSAYSRRYLTGQLAELFNTVV